MFGQYSSDYQGRLTKRDMVAAVATSHANLVEGSAEKVENNTLRFKLADGSTVVRHFQTDIIRVDRAGNVTLDGGGYRSMTTRGRFNAYLPSGFQVHADKGWHIHTPAGVFPFVDGARFNAKGEPLNQSKLDKAADKVKREKALVAKFLRHAKEKGWADPAGDPWIFEFPDRELALDYLRTNYFTRRLMGLALDAHYKSRGSSAITLNDMERRGGKLTDAHKAGILRKALYKALGIAG